MRPRKVILYVDGNEQAISVRKFMLETRGYRVVSVLHAEAALELFEAGGIDLVLSELNIPGMDGNEMVRRMKAQAPDVPMMLVSHTVKEFARADAADAFLPKGAATSTELLERIRVLMVRKRGPKRVAAPQAPAASQTSFHQSGLGRAALAPVFAS
jgi:CheY-like chemotaxis protein